MNELDAARFVRAALYLIRPEVPESDTDLALMLSRWTGDVHERIESLEKTAPPWEPERPEIPSTWGQVCAGDQVLAPDGVWYKVDAWSRTGEQVSTLIVVNGENVPTGMPAAGKVMVRRGPEGKAVDVFAAAGIELERIGRA